MHVLSRHFTKQYLQMNTLKKEIPIYYIIVPSFITIYVECSYLCSHLAKGEMYTIHYIV